VLGPPTLGPFLSRVPDATRGPLRRPNIRAQPKSLRSLVSRRLVGPGRSHTPRACPHAPWIVGPPRPPLAPLPRRVATVRQAPVWTNDAWDRVVSSSFSLVLCPHQITGVANPPPGIARNSLTGNNLQKFRQALFTSGHCTVGPASQPLRAWARPSWTLSSPQRTPHTTRALYLPQPTHLHRSPKNLRGRPRLRATILHGSQSLGGIKPFSISRSTQASRRSPPQRHGQGPHSLRVAATPWLAPTWLQMGIKVAPASALARPIHTRPQCAVVERLGEKMVGHRRGPARSPSPSASAHTAGGAP
jgi:hypothetical protein